MHKHFGHDVEALAEADIDAVFHAVETGRADFAVVPVENSTEGAIGAHARSALLPAPLKICGEVMLPIHQNLMRKACQPGRRHSASMAMRNRSRNAMHWLNRNLPACGACRVVSNAEAARRAAAEPGAATLGSEAAAELYGLAVVAAQYRGRSQQHHAFSGAGANRRRTVRARQNLAGDGRAQPAGRGASNCCNRWPMHGISMSKLESRPARLDHFGMGNWEYLFFVVCEGHRQDAELAAALAEIETRAAFLKILGSYPAASS